MLAEQSPPWRYKPFRPHSLSQLTERLVREGLGEYAEFASAYASNSAVLACIEERCRPREPNAWRDFTLAYQQFLVSELLGKPLDVSAILGGTKPDTFFPAYGKLQEDWAARGSRRLPEGMEAAYNFVTWINQKKAEGKA